MSQVKHEYYKCNTIKHDCFLEKPCYTVKFLLAALVDLFADDVTPLSPFLQELVAYTITSMAIKA